MLKAFVLDVEEEVTGRTCKAYNQLIGLGTTVTVSVRGGHLQMTSSTRDRACFKTLPFHLISIIRILSKIIKGVILHYIFVLDLLR